MSGTAANIAIETQSLTRRFGKMTAVDQLSVQIPSGSLYGLIGPNGAGKTTTLRMLAGLLEPSAGEILINGVPVLNGSQGPDWRELQRQIGYMPDFFGVYEDLVVWEYLDFFARCYDLPAARRHQVTGELLELVDLTEKRDDYVQNLSRGMRQRLCLAHALVHDPQILLLDEPASGLDPRARVEMRELLRELSAMGKTIVLSSHILSELAELCDSVGIIEKGRLVVSGPLPVIQAQLRSGRTLRIRVLSDPSQASAVLKNQAGVGVVYPLPETPGNGNGGERIAPVEAGLADVGQLAVEDQLPAEGPLTFEVEFSGDENASADLLAAILSAGVRVAAFSETSTDLEEVFLRLTKGEVA